MRQVPGRPRSVTAPYVIDPNPDGTIKEKGCGDKKDDRTFGADETLDSGREDLRAALKTLTGGRGPDVIYDPVGGALAEPAFRSIAWRGRYLVVGFAGGAIPALPWNLALLKGAAVVGVFWGAFTAREPARNEANIAELFALYAAGRIRPRVSAHFPLADAAQAIRHLADRKAIGKVVVTV